MCMKILCCPSGWTVCSRIREFVEEILDVLGLREKRNAMPNQLSGRQQQRVALARALASHPAIVLLDEPTGNLDSATSQDVMGLIRVSAERFGQTLVMITHNEELAQMAHRHCAHRRRPDSGRGCGNMTLKVSNASLIRELAAKTWRANRKRNFLTIFAIFLTSLLITVVLGPWHHLLSDPVPAAAALPRAWILI